jgi:hypothetical protein
MVKNEGIKNFKSNNGDEYLFKAFNEFYQQHASIVNILMPTLDATKWNLGTNEQIFVGKNTKHDIRG